MKLKDQKIYSAFFRESKTFYKINDLKELLKLEDSSKETATEHAERIYDQLLRCDVIKACTKKQFELNELPEDELARKEEEDPSIVYSNDKGFFFKFVGVVYVDDCVIKVYPKYIDLNKESEKSSPYDFNNSELSIQKSVEKHFAKTLRTIRLIQKKDQKSSLSNQTQESYNHIGMQIYLLEDYYCNGLYENKETIIETNGEGEIDWDKTINETTAIIKNKKPYYVELQTINTRSNEFDYFKMLHESILCQCSKTLRDSGLLKYLGMTPCELTGIPLSSFGDISFIKYKLQQEIRTQFITKKRNQLISLLTYISETTGSKSSNSLKLFGSYHFEHDWEVVCKAVFDDLYKNDFRFSHSELGDSPSIKELLDAEYLKDGTEPERTNSSFNFNKMIERVEWNMNGIPCKPDGSLTPDIISIDEKDHFYILDAKYYLIKVNEESKSIENQPGIQDVLKQFAYERAYGDFLKDYRFYRTVNAFVIPALYSDWSKEKRAITCIKGHVNFSLMQTSSYENLGSLQVLEVIPDFIYDSFLQSKLCLSDLTKVLTEKGLLHSINRRISRDGTDVGLTMVGFLRASYMKQIENGNEFWFYFYVKKGFRELQIHPELLRCSKFIGYEEQNADKTVITGTVIPEIRKVSGAELRQLVINSGYEKKSEDKPEYYCIKIENAVRKSMSSESFDKLLALMKDAPGNYLLEKYSPKVI